MDVKIYLSPIEMKGYFSPEDPASRISSNSNWKIKFRSQIWQPPTDVYETDTNLIIRVEIAGMKEDDFKIELTADSLTISGFRNDNLFEKRAFHQMEIRFGSFETLISFNLPICIEDVTARYSEGFLMITLPKASAKKISVESSESE